MENELFNIVLCGNECGGGIVLGSFTFDELREEFNNIFANILPKCKDPADALDGLEIVRCVKHKDDAEK